MNVINTSVEDPLQLIINKINIINIIFLVRKPQELSP